MTKVTAGTANQNRRERSSAETRPASQLDALGQHLAISAVCS
jgi:hypothetical protein